MPLTKIQQDILNNSHLKPELIVDKNHVWSVVAPIKSLDGVAYFLSKYLHGTGWDIVWNKDDYTHNNCYINTPLRHITGMQIGFECVLVDNKIIFSDEADGYGELFGVYNGRYVRKVFQDYSKSFGIKLDQKSFELSCEVQIDNVENIMYEVITLAQTIVGIQSIIYHAKKI